MNAKFYVVLLINGNVIFENNEFESILFIKADFILSLFIFHSLKSILRILYVFSTMPCLVLRIPFALSAYKTRKNYILSSVRNSIIQHYDFLLETDDNAIIKLRTD